MTRSQSATSIDTDGDHQPAQSSDEISGPVIEVDGLSRVFEGPPEVTALFPCTFRIEHGEYVAITGPSGSGKTTLLSLLGLLDPPTSGTYRLDGIDVADLSDAERAAVRAHRIGFVFQAFHLVGYRSVIDNVELGLTYQGVPHRQRRQHALEMIERVGLSHRTHALCTTLSGGEKQRVAIARTLIRHPALVLCDEPTGNLDTATSNTVLELIEGVHRDGLTVIIITHDPAIAERTNRNLTIIDGHVTEPEPVSV
ncbi:MAG: ABC transporter ATP-binding protein [Rhodococcus sp. (in: high G+C Gram-positive bacteria)]